MSTEIQKFDSTSVVWCERKSELVKKAKQIVSIPEDDNALFDYTTGVIGLLKDHITALEVMRKTVTSELDKQKKELIAKERELGSELNEELVRLQMLSGNYIKLQVAKEEAQKKQQEKQEAELASMQEEAQANGLDSVFMPSFNNNEVVKAVSTNANIIEEYKFEITDPTEVPRTFCTPNESLIRGYLSMCKKQGMKSEQIVIPGVKITREFRTVKKR